MTFRAGQNRHQFGLPSRMTIATPLYELIAPDNLVRVIEAFMNAIDLEQLGFVHVKAQHRSQLSAGVEPPRQIHTTTNHCNMRRAVTILAWQT